MHDTINSRLNSEKACYHSPQNFFFHFGLKSRKTPYWNIWESVLPVILCCFQSWSIALNEDKRLRIFKHRLTRKIFAPNTEEITEDWRKLYKGVFNDFHTSPPIVKVIKSQEMQRVWHVARWRVEEKYTGFGVESLRNYMEALDLDSSILVKCI